MEGYKRNGDPDFGFWQEQIAKGRKFRKDVADENMWDTWKDYYHGNWMPGVMPSNVFFKMLRTIVPRVYFRDPGVSVLPAKPGLENLLFAQVLERTDNKLVKAMRLKKSLKKIVQQTFLYGTGFGKLGYAAEHSPSPEQFVVDAAAPISERGEKVEYHSLIRENMPWYLPVHPKSIVLPAGCDDFDGARWATHLVERAVEDVKIDPRFDNRKDLKGGQSRTVLIGDNQYQLRRPVSMLEIAEIRDKKTGKVFVFDLSGGNLLFFGDDAFQYHNRISIHQLLFNEAEDSCYGIADAKVLEPIQLELNETRTQIMKHRRMSIVRLLVQSGAMKPDQAEKLVSETVLPVVWVEGDVNSVVKVLQSAGIPQDLLVNIRDMYQEMREQVGFSRNAMGEAEQGSEKITAAEAKIVAAASEIRIDERRDMLADMLTNIVSDMHRIIFKYWTEEQIVDIIGPTGAPIWVSFKGSMLENGDYTISVDPDSGLPQTKALREQKAVQIYQLFRQDPLINPERLVQNTLRELQGVQYDELMMTNQPGGNPEQPIAIESLLNQLQQGQ